MTLPFQFLILQSRSHFSSPSIGGTLTSLKSDHFVFSIQRIATACRATIPSIINSPLEIMVTLDPCFPFKCHHFPSMDWMSVVPPRTLIAIEDRVNVISGNRARVHYRAALYVHYCFEELKSFLLGVDAHMVRIMNSGNPGRLSIQLPSEIKLTQIQSRSISDFQDTLEDSFTKMLQDNVKLPPAQIDSAAVKLEHILTLDPKDWELSFPSDPTEV